MIEGATLTVTAAAGVLSNDVPGADGYAAGGGVVGVRAAGADTTTAVQAGVNTTIPGSYGSLVLQADGSYVYHATANSNPPAGATDTFVYTIKDGDGDLSTTTLTIGVADLAPAIGSATTYVSEEVLPGIGTERGGDNDADPTHDVLTNSGTLTLTDTGNAGATFTTHLVAPSGSYTSGGVAIVWALTNSDHTLTGTAGVGGPTVLVATLTNAGAYTVTLSAPIDTPNVVGGLENGGDAVIAIGVTATDNLGNTASPGTITVHVEDDAPKATLDTNSVIEGATLTVIAASGVLSNDVAGADGYAAGGGVVGVRVAGSDTTTAIQTGVNTTITGTYGTLVLQADGSYVYHATSNSNPPAGSTDTFVYTIKDGDGDLSTTTLTISVADAAPAVGSATTYVSEEVLPLVGTERGGDNDSDAAKDVLVNSGNLTLSDPGVAGATFTTALVAPVGTYTSGGTAIVWTLSNGGHTLTGAA